VIYNGRSRWTAVTQLSRLTTPTAYFGQFQYELLELAAQRARAWAQSHNVAALFVRLELAATGGEFRRMAMQFVRWHQQPGEEELKKNILQWFKGQAALKGDETLLEKIQGVEDMGIFAENLELWIQESKEQGRQQGREQGRQQGMEQGRQEGRQQGELKMLTQMVRSKFGVEFSERLTPTYARLLTTESRNQFIDWVIQSETKEQLLEHIRSSANGIN